MCKLLTRGASSPKLMKGSAGIESVILHLAPGKTCPWASAGCLAACLNTAGRGAMSSVQLARQRRTDWFFSDRDGFLRQLDRELTQLEKRAAKKGFTPVARLNGTSDIPWESMRFYLPQEEYYGFAKRSLFERHPDIVFYDYTKSIARVRKASAKGWPTNYTLTLSRTEDMSEGAVAREASMGVNVAVVFDVPKGQPLPRTFEGVPVVDGRADDWRFKDPRGVVVGLSALGKARKDTTGFVVEVK